MENTKETAEDYIREILVKNGFEQNFDGRLFNNNCHIKIEKDWYKISHFDEAFLEWMDYYTPDLSVYSLMGYLSFNDFISRGYDI